MADMITTQMKRNPVIKQRYWEEVCCREDRQHIFHPSQTARPRERGTPLSTAQSSYQGGQGLVCNVTVDFGLNSFLQQRSSSLSTAARSSIQAPATPRAGAGASCSQRVASARGRTPTPWGTPQKERQGSGTLAATLRSTLAPESRALPAGL
uniref:Uncharacterized protein n=1 Tax=Alexandrium monilatum TaxID=311494 RepID=A0A7S4VA49_9DINO